MKDHLIFLYAAILAVMAAAMILCRKEDLFTDEPLSVFMRPFRRLAVRLYRRISAAGAEGRLRPLRVPWHFGRENREKISNDLMILFPGSGHSMRVMDHEVTKLTNLLLFLFLAALMASCASAAASLEDEEYAGGMLFRDGYRGSTRSIILSEEHYGDFAVEVAPQEYTPEETERMAEEVFALLPALITRGAGTDAVSSDLYLPSRIPASAGDYPFLILWDSSSYAVIETDGSVHPPESGSKKVVLTAVLHYAGLKFAQDLEVTVIPPAVDEADALKGQIRGAIEEAELETRKLSGFALPSSVAGVALAWDRKKKSVSLILFLIVAAAGAAAYVGADRDIYRKIEKRQRQMAADYPQILSKLVLYTGAGMSMRNAFMKLGQEYTAAGTGKRYAYEEILLVCRELESGVSESRAYAHFGRRCRMKQYSKLASILSQKLKKGGDTLMRSLEEAMQAAYEERRNIARQLGEEAGTKLLLPMVIMLAVTMIMIIVPVYLGMELN